jgi:succinate dehydrogenase / fumarate reductase iron-sulfur subunit
MSATIRVSRFKSGDAEPRFEDFEVEVESGATLLDALLQIRRRDPSLVIRHSCKHASCGACGMRANGREVLACDTKVTDLHASRPIKVEPLAGRHTLADLATDMTDFHARMDAVGMPLVRSAETAADVVPPEGIKTFARFENCIECGLCLSACPIAKLDAEYIGPAALAAAERVVEEPRGRDLGPVLALASEPDSVWRCRDAMGCSAVCPAAVDPAGALFRLRRRVASYGLRKLFRRGTAQG